MTIIKKLAPCQVLSANRVTLECGHTLLLAGKYKVGTDRRCEACLTGDPKVIDITTHDKYFNLFLSCGDTRQLEMTEQFPTLDSVVDFIGTNHPCRGVTCISRRKEVRS